jgi:hypothetical protein
MSVVVVCSWLSGVGVGWLLIVCFGCRVVCCTVYRLQTVATRESMSIVLPVRRLVRLEVAARHRQFIAKKFAPKNKEIF